ncbi:uncharacterized protein LOC111027582 [Myzus persicae]|uniref:uncharacterized protein LOC111027582 n=1 Tax=Myzus persicae TaxID=13164 RepID=UPI000B9332CB|nr:uncharacterized protein LOC111027582 [Myzus persicae]
MTYNTLFMFVQLLMTICSGWSANSNPLLSSPIGPYRVVFKQVYICNPKQNNKIQHYLYLSHKANSTWIFGNTTLEIPLDDTFFLEMSMSVKDSFGNWKENVFMHKVSKACSSFKKLMGNTWKLFLHGNGIQNTECPILPGVYKSPGFDLSLFDKSNFPKSFFYGTYKFRMFYSKSNEIFGCQVYIIELKRP